MVPPRGCAYVQMAERDAAYRALNSRKIQRLTYSHPGIRQGKITKGMVSAGLGGKGLIQQHT